jgi:hypothetical protein
MLNRTNTDCSMNELEVDVRATAFDPCIVNRKGWLFSGVSFVCCNLFHKLGSSVCLKAPVTLTVLLLVLLCSSYAWSCCLYPATGVCAMCVAHDGTDTAQCHCVVGLSAFSQQYPLRLVGDSWALPQHSSRGNGQLCTVQCLQVRAAS